VLPVLESKAPACPHGFKDASRDPDEIERLWRRYPGPLIGIATGAVSGVDALDIDAKHESARAWLRAAEGRIPPTRTYRTRSGGLHLYWRHAEGVRNSESRLARGIDTRGAGGFIICWYAAGFECVDHAPPAPWPRWLLDALLAPPPPAIIHRRPRTLGHAGNAAARRMVDAAIDRVVASVDGERHATLRAAACTIGGLLDAAGLSQQQASDLLFNAIVASTGGRLNRSKALDTIDWGLTRGALSPLLAGAA
jgi:hypothetical protein